MMGPWSFTLLGEQMQLVRPWALLLALAFLALIPVGIVFGSRRVSRIRQVFGARLGPQLTEGISVARPILRSVLQCLGFSLLAVALAQPQCGGTPEPIRRQGLDVVVALDASKSMLARDVEPDRITRAKLELTTLLDSLKGDRVGIVAFAGLAHVQCPLTSDYAAAKLFLRAVDPQDMPQGGTNVADALHTAARMLEESGSGVQDRVVVLLTDGEDLEGNARAAAEELATKGIRILAVGIGSEEGETIPIFNRHGQQVGLQRDLNGEVVVSRLDAAGLQRLAEQTAGAYFHVPRGVAVTRVVERLDGMKRAEFESRITYRYQEQFQRFLFAGLFFWALGLLVQPSRRPKGEGA